MSSEAEPELSTRVLCDPARAALTHHLLLEAGAGLDPLLTSLRPQQPSPRVACPWVPPCPSLGTHSLTLSLFPSA